MSGKKDFGSSDGGTTVLDIPPIDSINIQTGGHDDESPFQKWRKKFKNYATYLTHRKLNNN